MDWLPIVGIITGGTFALFGVLLGGAIGIAKNEKQASKQDEKTPNDLRG